MTPSPAGAGRAPASAPRVFERASGYLPVGEILLADTRDLLTPAEAWAVRERRLAGWCRDQRLTLPPDLVPFLMQCDSASEVRFVLALLAAAPGWRPDGPDGPTVLVHPDLLPDPAAPDDPLTLRAQVPVGPYRVDLVLAPRSAWCGPGALAIEVDGPTHATAVGRARDAVRQQALDDAGFVTARLPARLATVRGAALGRQLYTGGA